MPPEVRKRSASVDWHKNLGLCPKAWASPKFNIELAGRPEAFRTSDAQPYHPLHHTDLHGSAKAITAISTFEFGDELTG